MLVSIPEACEGVQGITKVHELLVPDFSPQYTTRLSGRIMVSLFEDTSLYAIHAKCVSIMGMDMQLERHIRGEGTLQLTAPSVIERQDMTFC